MTSALLSSIWSGIVPALCNHLWQSTLFALAAGLLTLTLRKNHAAIRYWLWLAASAKFLIPFSLLVAIGNRLGSPHASAETSAGVFVTIDAVIDHMSQPFSPAAAASSLSAASTPGLTHLLPAILVTAWFCGFAAVLVLWGVRWRRISTAMHGAVPSREGREVEALRRLERIAGTKPI